MVVSPYLFTVKLPLFSYFSKFWFTEPSNQNDDKQNAKPAPKAATAQQQNDKVGNRDALLAQIRGGVKLKSVVKPVVKPAVALQGPFAAMSTQIEERKDSTTVTNPEIDPAQKQSFYNSFHA